MPGCECSYCTAARGSQRSIAALRNSVEPTLIIENKLLYRERGDAALPPGYELSRRQTHFPTTVLRRKASPT